MEKKKYLTKNFDSKKVAKSLICRIEREITKEKRYNLRKKALAAISASSTLTGCTTFGANQMFGDSDRGFVMLAGDAEGIRAYNDGINGVITNTKSSPDVKSSYWQNRDKEVKVRVFRTPYYANRSYTKQVAAMRNNDFQGGRYE